ncbi:YihY/virulence factor BrkB family protein [Actinomadura darangshiensis]|uniref:YihY/virulence factor BrkB family protein n=1 Tax=Actinomadura darangshiensis TaxID=705336 RepID=A0A4R5BPS7_9ACTN|nr:YihY/virulence factor BrkB family protein [Actinomadura darangshiensis]TDD87200.1 YihY/virulence factor BrkB family protein [Actinomadura darangshiensis]
MGSASATPGRTAAPARGVLKRTAGEFKKDNVTAWAAALTYYSVLSIFPAILVVVSLVGLAGQSATDDLIDGIGDLAPGSVRDLLISSVRQLQGGGGAGVLAIVGLLAAVWSASGYVGAFMQASNVVYDVPEGRPFWKTIPLRVAVTIVTLVLLSVSAVAVVVTGPLARKVGDGIGAGSQAVTVWNIAKWPVLLLVVAFLFMLLYWAAPNAKRGLRGLAPGALLAIVVWIVASALFALYVGNFASYNKTYGSIAGVIIFLVWLWITNLAILLGAELNAELERGRAIASGMPAGEEPYVEPRDTRAFDEEDRRETGWQDAREEDDGKRGVSGPSAPQEAPGVRRGDPGARH